jgi:hypothetical protein
VVSRPAVEVEIDGAPRRDHVRWGPVLAGVVTAFAVLLFLTVLGVALGLSAFGRGETAATWGTAAGIWGGLSLLVAFFAGGWMAGRSATPTAEADGVLNGFITGAATLLILLWLATTAVTGALGFFASTVADIAGAAAPAAMEAVEQGQVPAGENVETAVTEAVQDPAAAVPEQVDEAATAAAQTAQESAGPGAWGTAIAILLAVGAATLGGKIGKEKSWTMPGARAVVAAR